MIPRPNDDNRIKIAPSILSADLSRLAEQVRRWRRRARIGSTST